MTKDNLIPGRWYIDRTVGHEGQPLNQRFKLLAVQDERVVIVDEAGYKLSTNRLLWERDMEPDNPPPLKKRKKVL